MGLGFFVYPITCIISYDAVLDGAKQVPMLSVGKNFERIFFCWCLTAIHADKLTIA